MKKYTCYSIGIASLVLLIALLFTSCSCSSDPISSNSTAVNAINNEYRFSYIESRLDTNDRNTLALTEAINKFSIPNISGKAEKSEIARLDSQLVTLQSTIDKLLAENKYTQEKLDRLSVVISETRDILNAHTANVTIHVGEEE